MELDKKILAELAKEFPEDRIHLKPGVMSKDKTKAMWLSYLQHTDTAQRLDDVVGSWSFKPVERWETGGKKYVWAELTIFGVTRGNVGEGDEWKDAFSDCLKRCAMSFGIGRYLYDQEKVWTDFNEDMKYKTYFLSDLPQLRKGNSTPTTKNKSNGSNSKKGNPKHRFMKACASAKEAIGEENYYFILDQFGYKKCNEVSTEQEMTKVFKYMEEAVNRVEAV